MAQGVYLIASFLQGSWVLDVDGQPIATDFVNIWSGGHQILLGEDPAASMTCSSTRMPKPERSVTNFLANTPGCIPQPSSCSQAHSRFVASCAAFGVQAWAVFFRALPIASQAALAEGRADWGKLQSVFAVARLLGGSEALAWTLQLGLAVAVATVLWQLWRSRISFDLKAAALSVGALLVTPYLFLYDLVLLAIAMAFLIRAGAGSRDARLDAYGIGCASLLVLLFPFLRAPVGLAAVLLVASLVLRRAVGIRVIPALHSA
jgi:hypothetical protein